MTNSEKIRRKALSLGFDLCGIARCRSLERQYDRFKNWLADGCDGGLEYLRRNTGNRFDPGALCEGARSVIVCGVGYHRPPSAHEVASRIASYAHSRDYHLTIRERLNELSAYLRELVPGASGRVFTDTAPLAEKQLAVEAGLGWIGRQSLLVTPQYGSYVVLGELILTEETDRYDTPFEGSRCGTCRSCIDNCPTGAVAPDRTIDTGRCISCRTIEREQPGQTDLHGWIFGCDACQSLCPWNRRAPQHRNAAFDAVFDPLAMDAATWLGMDEAAFEALCGRTPLTRSGLVRIRENALRNAAPEEPSER